MSSNDFATRNPAYVVLYDPLPDGQWRGRVVDIPGCEGVGHRLHLTKRETQYAVLYSPTQDGRWSASVLDLPECKPGVSRLVHEAKLATRAKVKKLFERYQRKELEIPPAPTVGRYIRPETHGIRMDDGSAESAVIRAVEDYRSEHGGLPRPQSVFGYVDPFDPEEDENG